MASTSPEPRDKRDRCNVGVSFDKIQAKQALSATTFSGPLVKESLIGLMPRKLLNTKRLLVLDMKALSSSLKKCKSKEEFCKITPKFEEVSVSYNDFRKALDEVTDIDIAFELSDLVADLFEESSNLHEICKQRYFYCLKYDSCDQMTEVKVTDSVSQVSRGISSSTSKTRSAARLIELECKRSALRAVRDLELAKAKAKAQEAKAQEAAIEAEAKARFSIEEAKLEAEAKLLKLSERGPSLASKSALRRIRSIKGSTKGSVIGAVPQISFSVNQSDKEFYDGGVIASRQTERKQRPKYENRHSGVLHEFHSGSTSVNLGAAKPVSTEKSNEKEDELIEPSRNDRITRLLQESNIKVDDNCYEIPVPIKTDVSNVLSSKFYFFITKQKKPRVVSNGAASYKGFSLNDAFYPGITLLSGLVENLTRFRLQEYACMADLSKCPFQIFLPKNQRDLFRLIWYENNDIDPGVTKIFHFTRHIWIISRKELEAAKLCAELMRDISDSLKYLGCSLYFWTDSQVVLKWIVNPALRLVRFVKRRVDKIHRVGFVDNWNYVCSSFNPADAGTRDDSLKGFVSHPIWIKGPSFLYEGGEEVRCPVPVTARKLLLNTEPSASTDIALQNLIETAPNLYTLSKRAAYLVAFK